MASVYARRARAAFDAHLANTARQAPGNGAPLSRVPLAFAPGDAVIDTVTGQEGTIYAGHEIAALIPASNPTTD